MITTIYFFAEPLNIDFKIFYHFIKHSLKNSNNVKFVEDIISFNKRYLYSIFSTDAIQVPVKELQTLIDFWTRIRINVATKEQLAEWAAPSDLKNL